MTAFAYAPPLLDDEPLDGWLQRIAVNVRARPSDVLALHGLKSATAHRPIRDFTREDIARLSDLTGIEPDRLWAATLHRWQRLGLTPDKRQRGHQGGAWAASTVARFCAECLEERDGIHRLQWRVIWSFACVRHASLLNECGGREPAYGAPGRGPCVSLDRDHPALSTQATIDEILLAPAVPVSYLGSTQSAAEYLSDLGVLTRIVVNRSDLIDRDRIDVLSRHLGGDWAAVAELLPDPLPKSSPAAWLAQAARHPSVIAVGTSAAAAVLNATNPSAARDRTWWMTTRSRKELLWHASARGVSYRLWQTLSAHEDIQPRAAVLKRFSLTRRDPEGQLISPVHSPKVPAACWDSVIPRNTQNGSALEAVAASVALLVTATDLPVGRALSALGLDHLRRHITEDWNQLFAATANGDRNFHYLLGLHKALGSGHIPIDYARRRRTFPEPPEVGRKTRGNLLRGLGEPNVGHVSAHLSWFLWELLTGGDFLSSSHGHLLPAHHRRLYRARRAPWAATQPKVFYETAELMLYRHNIDEPVTWQPELRNGMWVLPEPTERHLDCWAETNRPMRKSSQRDAVFAQAYGLSEVVALAASGSGQAADRARKHIARFIAVVETASLNEAAVALGISSSAISGSTVAFEKSIGLRLFDRGGKALALTPAGRRLQQMIVREGLSRDVLANLSQDDS